MNTLIKARDVKFDQDYLIVFLEDERIIQTPLKWYKELSNAKLNDLKNGILFAIRQGLNGKI